MAISEAEQKRRAEALARKAERDAKKQAEFQAAAETNQSVPAATPPAATVTAPKATDLRSEVAKTAKAQAAKKEQTVHIDPVQAKIDEMTSFVDIVMDQYLEKMKPNSIIDPEEGAKAQMNLLNLIGKVLRNEDQKTYAPMLEQLFKRIAENQDVYFDNRHSHRFFDRVAVKLGSGEQYRKAADLLNAFIKLSKKATRRMVLKNLPQDVAFGMLRQEHRDKLVNYLES